MKSFTEYLKEKKVKKDLPNPAEARSLIKQSEDRLADLNSLPISELNAPFRFESAYEALREALQSFLAVKGYKPYSQDAIFANNKEKNLLSIADFEKENRYREIRNNINYRGKKVLKSEAEEIISFVYKIVLKLKNLG